MVLVCTSTLPYAPLSLYFFQFNTSNNELHPVSKHNLPLGHICIGVTESEGRVGEARVFSLPTEINPEESFVKIHMQRVVYADYGDGSAGPAVENMTAVVVSTLIIPYPLQELHRVVGISNSTLSFSPEQFSPLNIHVNTVNKTTLNAYIMIYPNFRDVYTNCTRLTFILCFKIVEDRIEDATYMFNKFSDFAWPKSMKINDVVEVKRFKIDADIRVHKYYLKDIVVDGPFVTLIVSLYDYSLVDRTKVEFQGIDAFIIKLGEYSVSPNIIYTESLGKIATECEMVGSGLGSSLEFGKHTFFMRREENLYKTGTEGIWIYHLSQCNIEAFYFYNPSTPDFGMAITGISRLRRFDSLSVATYYDLFLSRDKLIVYCALYQNVDKGIVIEFDMLLSKMRRYYDIDIFTIPGRMNLVSPSSPGDQYVMLYDLSGSNTLLVVPMNIGREYIKTDLSSLYCDENVGESLVSVRVSASGEVQEQIFEINLRIMCGDLLMLDQVSIKTDYFFKKTELETLETILSFDRSLSSRSDIVFVPYETESEAEFTITSQYSETLIRTNIFRTINGETISFEQLTTDQKRTFQYNDYLLFQYNNKTCVFYHCFSDNQNKYDNYFCTMIFSFNLPILLNDDIIDFIAFNRSQTNYTVFLSTLSRKDDSLGSAVKIVATTDVKIKPIVTSKMVVYPSDLIDARCILYRNVVFQYYLLKSCGSDPKNPLCTATFGVFYFEAPAAIIFVDRVKRGFPLTIRNVLPQSSLRLHLYDPNNVAILIDNNLGEEKTVLRTVRLRYVQSSGLFTIRAGNSFQLTTRLKSILAITRHKVVLQRTSTQDLEFYGLSGEFYEILSGRLPEPFYYNTEGYTVEQTPFFYKCLDGILVVFYRAGKMAYILIYDLRFAGEHPIDRLIYEQLFYGVSFDELLQANVQNRILVLIDRWTFKLIVILLQPEGTQYWEYQLYGTEHIVTLKPKMLSSSNNHFLLSSDNVFNQTTFVNYVAVGTEYSKKLSIIASSERYKVLQEAQSNLQNSKPANISLENLVSFSGPVSRFSLEGKTVPKTMRLTQNAIAKLPLGRITFSNPNTQTLYPSFPTLGPLITKQDRLQAQSDAHIIVSNQNSISIYTPSRTKVSLLFEDKNLTNLEGFFVHLDQKINYTVRGSGKLSYFLTLHNGEYGQKDIKFYIIDSENPSVYSWFILKGFCDCKSARFEVTSRENVGTNQEAINFILFYKVEGFNGTTRFVTKMKFLPLSQSERQSSERFTDSNRIYNCSDTKTQEDNVLKGFKVVPSEEVFSETFKYKPIEMTNYGIIKPITEIAILYFFFEDTSQLGLVVADNERTRFLYFTYSTDCMLKSSSKFSCYTQTQNMLIRCMVQCDLTRIENFVLKMKAEELQSRSTEDSQRTGIELKKGHTYSIPVDYNVLQVIKAQEYDIVVAEYKNNGYILFYSDQSGEVFSVLEATHICPNATQCLRDVYVYQLAFSYLLIVPKETYLGNGFYERVPITLTVPANIIEGRISDLEDSMIVVHGINGERAQMRLSTVFDNRETDVSNYYSSMIVILVVALIMICILIIYLNWGDDGAQKEAESYLDSEYKQRAIKVVAKTSFLNESQDFDSINGRPSIYTDTKSEKMSAPSRW